MTGKLGRLMAPVELMEVLDTHTVLALKVLIILTVCSLIHTLYKVIHMPFRELRLHQMII